MKTRHVAWLPLLLFAVEATAMPTENHGLPVLPAPADLSIDGSPQEWDLSQTLFVCGDVTRQAESFAVRIGAMADAKALYVLAYWYDRTPMNNPGQVSADFGWLGDSLQLRLRVLSEPGKELVTHVTAWRGVAGGEVVDLTYGQTFKDGQIKNAKTAGVLQAFSALADGTGYAQEIALPWALITADKKPLTPGAVLHLGVEANFTLENGSRLTIKGNFNPGEQIDRIFTYTKPQVWGMATLVETAPKEPRGVRLEDGRVFPTLMRGNIPVIDWTDLHGTEKQANEGVKALSLEIPGDGYLSTIIKDASGRIVRHLFSNQPVRKGPHRFSWDGLSTPNYDKKGVPVPVGDYTVHSLFHPAYDIIFRGWAGSSARTPWENGPRTNWGGDHGSPAAVAAGAERVFLGWANSESGRPLVACDTDGQVLWRKKFGGMSGVKGLAVDGNTLFVLGGAARGVAIKGGSVYKLDTVSGLYLPWKGAADAELKLADGMAGDALATPQETATGIAASGGRFYLSFNEANKVIAYEAETGRALTAYELPAPTGMAADPKGRLCILSGRAVTLGVPRHDESSPGIPGSDRLYVLDPEHPPAKALNLPQLHNAYGIAVDRAGRLFVGVRDPANQVHVYSGAGRLISSIGRAGGRALTGPWNPDGMRFIAGLAIDENDRLWVAEADDHPRRFSRWDIETGAFSKEFFGPTQYGANGAAINPVDPFRLVGLSAEWDIDPETGTARCLGVITREAMANSVYVRAPNGRLYLVTATEWRAGDIHIFERLDNGAFVKRAAFMFEGQRQKGKNRQVLGPDGNPPPPRTRYWADRNGDGLEQAEEVTAVDRIVYFNPWYLYVWPDFTVYAGDQAYPLQGFTPCGAPRFDLKNPTTMPAPGVGSLDSDVMLAVGGDWAATHSWYTAYSRKTGEKLWEYPNNFVGVHGSHKGPPFPQPGLIRGSYGPMNCIRLPDPIGNAWVLATNVGEWHVLTEEGFYLTSLFNGDYLDWRWPAAAVPGADMSGAPSGGGGEDFGGYITTTPDGRVFAQSGHTAYWLLEITGWEKTRRLPVQKLEISKADFRKAALVAQRTEGSRNERKRYSVARHTPGPFYANLRVDLNVKRPEGFAATEAARVNFAASWDDDHLYLGWDVKDDTPWINGAEQPEFMYARGDTVDFQMGTVPLDQRKGGKPAKGDLRLSIGNLKGEPVAVIYREIADTKQPASFSSGVIADYPMDWVGVVDEVKVQVKVRPDSYAVQAAVPWNVLGLRPEAERSFPADIGVTHGDSAGQDTVLRSYWNNRNTGLVNDEVFELKMVPGQWGVFRVE